MPLYSFILYSLSHETRKVNNVFIWLSNMCDKLGKQCKKFQFLVTIESEHDFSVFFKRLLGHQGISRRKRRRWPWPWRWRRIRRIRIAAVAAMAGERGRRRRALRRQRHRRLR